MSTASKPEGPPFTRRQKIGDFAIGFVGQLLLVGLGWVILQQSPTLMASAAPNILGLFDLITVFFISVRRPYIALGAVGVWALAFILGVLALVFLAVACSTGRLNL